MHDQCIIAEFENTQTARLGLQVLAKAGYGEDQLSFVSRSDDAELEEITKLAEDAPGKGAGASAGIGALLGGAFTAPLAASTLVGPFILVGPLVGVGLGAALGGMLGGAQRWGVDEEAGATYEEKVHAGHVLVIVTGSDNELREAEASLKTTGPLEIRRFASTGN